MASKQRKIPQEVSKGEPNGGRGLEKSQKQSVSAIFDVEFFAKGILWELYISDHAGLSPQ